MTETHKILLVEDNKVDRMFVKHSLKSTGLNFEIHEATDCASGLAAIENDNFDCVLLDYKLPDKSGIELLKGMNKFEGTNPPVILLTSTSDKKLGIKIIKEGAQDYLVKGHVNGEELARSILYAKDRHDIKNEVEKKYNELAEFINAIKTGSVDTIFNTDTKSGKIRLQDSGLIEENERLVKKLELNALIDEVLNDLEITINNYHANITVKPLPTIHGNYSQMKQLFQNLISNSLKYSKVDTKPEITISHRVNSTHHQNGNSFKKNYHLVTVSDNGIGIDERYSDRIFDIFQRLHGKNEYSGTGIGLAICKKIAEKHGGSISFKSKPGAGSDFVFTCPVSEHLN